MKGSDTLRHQCALGIDSVEDAQIAAIAKTAELALTTRNIKDFSDIEGLKLLNPWVEKV
jgi:predicted nucleic acid-binding protein